MLMRFVFPILILAASAAAQCTPGELAIVVNKANATDSLSMAQLRKLFLGDVHTWPDHKPVVLVRRDPSTNASKCVLSAVVRMSDGEYQRYMLNSEFRGDDRVQIRAADSDSAALKAVLAAPGSIAVVETAVLAAVQNLIRVVRINGKMPGESGYPL